MELKELDVSHAGLIVSQHELGMMGNALNDVCNRKRVSDFETKMGGDVIKVEQVLDDIIPIYREMERTGSKYASVRFTRFELRAIIGALKTVCEEIDLVEFHTLMGSYRNEVDEMLETLVPIYRKMEQLERSSEDN